SRIGVGSCEPGPEVRSMILLALLIGIPDLGRLASDAARIDRLIEQLGSPVYAERQTASRALERVGEPALEPLQTASEEAGDAEIRRRAERLVQPIEPCVREARARAIRESQLTPEQKGRKLKRLVKEGMTHEEVYGLLGMPGGMASSSRWSVVFYTRYRITISFDLHGKVESVDHI